MFVDCVEIKGRALVAEVIGKTTVCYICYMNIDEENHHFRLNYKKIDHNKDC